MKDEKINLIFQKALVDEMFFKNLIKKPISTIKKNKEFKSFDKKDFKSLKKIFSKAKSFSNRDFMEVIFRYSKGVKPFPVPPPPIHEYSKIVEYWINVKN
ncbi:MAG: hypothetical protein KDC88_09035 [Ignavibacteriae bacterium]|nr:hypothetical protein [Ignavibacteriota bacterium]MCB9206065.1 hypothetical protein [Ignavibacteriales bacterium]MCB9209339.1 hypothetical protein [Ignavibacteriales bacterium]MCB9257983.1 hypothetical protein [Ignavibacteriales bacterium]